MIKISSGAQQYFTRLLSDQDEADLGLRIRVLDAGTPGADCELTFCAPSEAEQGDLQESYDGFQLYIEQASAEWLGEARIDFETVATGGQLTIKAPNIKGRAPAPDASLSERVDWLLTTEINPSVASHGGRVALQEITENKEVVLQFGGGCHGCGMVDVTLRDGIEKTLREKLPEITAVIDATDHSSGENPYYR